MKVTVLCVRFGKLYGIDYVEKLRNMVSRHLTVPYDFVCITDDPTPIEGVRLIVQESQGYKRKWWHKVHMFDPALPVEGRILYFDLDVVIVNNIDKLVRNAGDEFFGIRDFNRRFHSSYQYLNSSVMSWVHQQQSALWQDFSRNPTEAQKLHGDQDWIWRHSRSRLKFWPDNWIQSYKWEIRSRDELVMDFSKKRSFKTVNNNINLNPDCSIMVFHGDPKPQNVEDQIVTENWR